MSCNRVLDEPVFISDWTFAKDLSALQANGITHILNVTSELWSIFPKLFQYKQIRVKSTPDVNLKTKLIEAINFIYKALDYDQENRVLVHCDAGDTRSAIIVVAFLMKRKQMSFQRCYNMLQRIRPQVILNNSFKKQLIDFQKSIEFLQDDRKHIKSFGEVNGTSKRIMGSKYEQTLSRVKSDQHLDQQNTTDFNLFLPAIGDQKSSEGSSSKHNNFQKKRFSIDQMSDELAQRTILTNPQVTPQKMYITNDTEYDKVNSDRRSPRRHYKYEPSFRSKKSNRLQKPYSDQKENCANNFLPIQARSLVKLEPLSALKSCVSTSLQRYEASLSPDQVTQNFLDLNNIQARLTPVLELEALDQLSKQPNWMDHSEVSDNRKWQLDSRKMKPTQIPDKGMNDKNQEFVQLRPKQHIWPEKRANFDSSSFTTRFEDAFVSLGDRSRKRHNGERRNSQKQLMNSNSTQSIIKSARATINDDLQELDITPRKRTGQLQSQEEPLHENNPIRNIDYISYAVMNKIKPPSNFKSVSRSKDRHYKLKLKHSVLQSDN